ncbi:MAG: hypothetical protein ACSLEX_01505 [Minisyncoccota bacterium]
MGNKKTSLFIDRTFFNTIICVIFFITALSMGPSIFWGPATSVFAQNDEEEEEEDEEDRTTAVQKKSRTTLVIQEVIEYRPVQETVTVTPEDYRWDTDGDTLVNAIDPDPLIPQSEYFTDTDADGVPNVIDLYPGNNDFVWTMLQAHTDPDSNAYAE